MAKKPVGKPCEPEKPHRQLTSAELLPPHLMTPLPGNLFPWIPERFATAIAKSNELPADLQREIEQFEKDVEPQEMKSVFWESEAEFWERQGQGDLQRHCRFLAQEWAHGLRSRSAATLLCNVTMQVYREAMERKKLVPDGDLFRARRAWAFFIIGFIYRQKPALSALPLRSPLLSIPPHEMSGYPRALESATRASWKVAGKDCEAWWENWLNNALFKSGAIERRKAPSKRIRRSTQFDEKPSVFVCGNWIQCHIWLMTADARLSFVRRYCPGTRALSLEALNKIVSRTKLFCHPAPPIYSLNKKTGEILVR